MEPHVDLKSSSTEPLSIGAAAAHFGLATHVLRHWESLGLLSPARDGGDRRRYRPDDLFRIAVILRGKEAGLSLDAIGHLIGCTDPRTRRTLLHRSRESLARRIAREQAALALLDLALACEHQDIARCPHFRQVLRDRAVAGARAGAVAGCDGTPDDGTDPSAAPAPQ